MARITALLVTLLLAGVAHAQRDFTAQKNSAGANAGQATKQAMNAKPPELWGHWIGQTEAQFFALEGATPKQYCAPQTDTEEQARLGPDFTAEKVYPCKRLKNGFNPQAESLDGYFYGGENTTPDPSGTSPDMSVLMGRVMFGGGYFMPSLPSRRAVFLAGRMVAIYDTVPNFEAALKDLHAKFGKPRSLTYSIEENALGARWRIGAAYWSIGNVIIQLNQIEEFGAHGAQIAMARRQKRSVAHRHNMFDK